MDFLYNLDISEKEIMEMIRNNKELLFLDDEKIKEVIYFLVKCGCTQKNIRNIIVANPYCFGRDVSDMEEVVGKIKGLGINDIDMFLENNPWLLSKDGFEYAKSNLTCHIMTRKTVDVYNSVING